MSEPARISRERLLLILSTKPLTETYEVLDAHLSAVYRQHEQAERALNQVTMERDALNHRYGIDTLRLIEERDEKQDELKRQIAMHIRAENDFATCRTQLHAADQAMACAAGPLEILKATECDETAVALNPALKRMIITAVDNLRAAILTARPTP